ncbi:unnamed protein product [Clonostachys rosea f. rosea IK726]|uniref:Intradiol ring-cleavage dioxygenases domain-containing protein n=2 Tax=Bionectria ochroleuca TaxID=29856 RepID=A0A0B7K9G4_BIOOC|nr:unnamed protein product [Clonostachys rosea f. rosea IK726]
MRLYSALGVMASAVSLGAAHPGDDPHKELHQRRDFMSKVERTDLAHCADKFKARDIDKRVVERRKNIMQEMALRRRFAVRDPEDINKSHLSPYKYDLDTPLDVIFGNGTSCLLSPEATEGPYYVAGEYVRQDITDSEPGVPLVVDFDVFDVETCEPLTDTYVEIWSCNSTGIYSGVSSGGDYTSAPENLKTTFLRGFQKTDDIGAIRFDGIFPGHYSGRTQHIHLMVHPNATERLNHTVEDITASHVGQVFFDQDLIDSVELLAPYNTNTQSVTKNAEDFHLEAILETSDPFLQYVLLGDQLSDGVLAWISFGVNTTSIRSVSAAAIYYEGGGIDNPNAGDPGGGGPGGPGGPPSGGFPTGTPLPTGTPPVV